MKTVQLPSLLLGLLVALTLSLQNCKKSEPEPTPEAPVVTTGAVTDSTQLSVRIAGSISRAGSQAVTDYGHVYSTTNATPTLADQKVSKGSAGTTFPLAFSSDIAGLTASTRLYVRAYATSFVGTSYGSVVEARTRGLLGPSITTGAATSVTSSSAVVPITFSNLGNTPVTEYGICYSTTNQTPTTTDSKTAGTSLASVSSIPLSLTGLTYLSTYYARAYVVSQAGTVYGNAVTFQTLGNVFVRRADFPGTSGDGAVAVTAGDKIYAGLGRKQKEWYVYDPVANVWTKKADFPNAKTSYSNLGTFVIGSKIFFVGGGIDNIRTDNLWEYDVTTDKWTQRKSLPGGARSNIASFATGWKGYALFGVTGWGSEGDFPTKSVVYEYDPTTDAWAQKADFPAKPRGNNITNTEYNGLVMVINGRPFVGGGSGSGSIWNDWYEYIPAQDTWQKRANRITDGFQHFGSGTMGYVLDTFTSNSRRYVYDATTDKWTPFPGEVISSPLDRNTLGITRQAAELNGRAYMGLGYRTSNTGNKEWWMYVP